MNLINKKRLLLIFVLILMISNNKQIFGQKILVIDENQPKVLMAVAPTFYPFVFNKTGVAEVVIEARINSEGVVVSTKTIDFTLFTDLSLEHTAKQWKFEKSSSQNERAAKIKFIFRIMPKETDLSDLVTIYRYPAEIEVRSTIIDSPKTTFPLPDKKKSRKSKP